MLRIKIAILDRPEPLGYRVLNRFVYIYISINHNKLNTNLFWQIAVSEKGTFLLKSGDGMFAVGCGLAVSW